MVNTLKSKLIGGSVSAVVMLVALVLGSALPAAAQTSSSSPKAPMAPKDYCRSSPITSTLKTGSKGAPVECLQSMLGIKVDGDFGQATKSAVMSFQKDNGIKADGVVGASTRAALEKNNSSNSDNSSSNNSSSSPSIPS
jgi:peptidoglycan hydrolase-like protein with peptidoglycan-binding domain